MELRIYVLAGALAFGVVASPAMAVPLFFNDFSNGLGASEAVTGQFQVSNGYVGHQASYRNNASDSYTVAVNTQGYGLAKLYFNYDNNIENLFDYLRVEDVTSSGISTLASFTGLQSGVASYTLAANTTSIRFRFTSDSTAVYSGVKIDNVLVDASPGFYNDFSTGLSSRESVSGEFKVGNGYVGHQTTKYNNNANDQYRINYDTSSFVDPVISFDYDINVENLFDYFRVFDNTASGRSLLSSYTSLQKGTALLSLMPDTSGVEFYFTSDSTANYSGVKLDNVHIFDRAPAAAAVPEPSTWSLMLVGFGLIGAAARCRHIVLHKLVGRSV